MFVRINGETHYLWRAVDHEGEVLEVYVTKRRDHKAALEFLRRAMRRYGRPATIVTDRLRSYGAAMKDIGVEDRQIWGHRFILYFLHLNNRLIYLCYFMFLGTTKPSEESYRKRIVRGVIITPAHSCARLSVTIRGRVGGGIAAVFVRSAGGGSAQM